MRPKDNRLLLATNIDYQCPAPRGYVAMCVQAVKRLAVTEPELRVLIPHPETLGKPRLNMRIPVDLTQHIPWYTAAGLAAVYQVTERAASRALEILSTERPANAITELVTRLGVPSGVGGGPWIAIERPDQARNQVMVFVPEVGVPRIQSRDDHERYLNAIGKTPELLRADIERVYALLIHGLNEADGVRWRPAETLEDALNAAATYAEAHSELVVEASHGRVFVQLGKPGLTEEYETGESGDVPLCVVELQPTEEVRMRPSNASARNDDLRQSIVRGDSEAARRGMEA